MIELPAERPLVVALAGPNGAGKSTFYEAYLADLGLRFVNADRLARELGLDPYRAAEVAARVRQQLVARRESFVFETVLSDPIGAKVADLARWQAEGYAVVLCFIGLDDAGRSDQRVSMRVSQGGHDVPVDKLRQRYPRSLANLGRALEELAWVVVYDHSHLAEPYRRLAIFHHGKATELAVELPAWFDRLLPA